MIVQDTARLLSSNHQALLLAHLSRRLLSVFEPFIFIVVIRIYGVKRILETACKA
jgi:hypothetical protein